MIQRLAIVVSCYNEEAGLNAFYQETTKVLDSCPLQDYRLIFVNDGSVDGTRDVLNGLASQDKRVQVIHFSRNFGHEAAMIAGIDHADADGIVCMDADLQHPPASIPAILEKFQDGFDVISMVRLSNADAGLVKKITSAAFYKVLNLMSPIRFEENSSDFFAVSARAAQVLRTHYRENVRYLRGYVQSIGFNKTTLPFTAAARQTGQSHYSLSKLIHYSITTLCGFSDVPLKLGIYSGLLAAAAGVVLIVYSIVMRMLFAQPGGYTTIVVALCFLFALTLIVIGIIGEYLSILLAEVKGRPLYLVQDTVNMERITEHPEL